MKRTSWLTWRIYFTTTPLNVIVLIFAADHKLKSFNEAATWGLVALISHFLLFPLVAIGVPQSQHWKSWKFDFAYLLLLGAVRGLVINICVSQFDLTQTVSYGYKIFNSMIALPQWFVAIAIFFESRREFQRYFRNLFIQAIRQERDLHDRKKILPANISETQEAIVRLQYFSSQLSNDLQKLKSRPNTISDYTNEAVKIQSLIDDNIKPASSILFKSNSIKTPKISFTNLVNASLLESRLRVFFVIAISIPYLFVGLNGVFGIRLALLQSLIVSLIDIALFLIFEGLFRFRQLNRKHSNLLIIGTSFIIPFLIQLKFLPTNLSISSDWLVIFSFQTILFISYVGLLIIVGSYSLLKNHRANLISGLEKIVRSDKLDAIISESRDSQDNLDLANYLHGEIQAGLTASSLLLQEAAKSGDSELAQEALQRASGLLNQDLTNITFTRMASPDVKIEKIKQAWKGIADISVSFPELSLLDVDVLRNSVTLIEEAISNSIRHAKASDIKISGVLNEDIFSVTIVSNGKSMTKGKAGLGTRLFDELADEWSFSAESGHNRLTFTLIK